MTLSFLDISVNVGPAARFMVLSAVAGGAILAFYGLSSAFSGRSAAAARMAPKHRESIALSNPADQSDKTPKGLSAAFIPKDVDERTQVGLALAQAGFRGENAVANYYAIRLSLGLGLPLIFLAVMAFGKSPGAPGWLAGYMTSRGTLSVAQHLAVLCCLGFFAPAYWLRSRIDDRKRRIEEAFPNLLDLLQVGVEAGMGFDQALMRVATEIRAAAPEIAEEVLTALTEIQAGRDREAAFVRMARRTGVDEMSSFVNVILQSAKFGTPMSNALMTYADEMRETRELRAQEKANKLPVQMSAVMAALMLPSLIALVLAPIVIRYLSAFGGS
ncbi:MAG: type II secretion system F family protein [Pseudodonghicola sp.]